MLKDACGKACLLRLRKHALRCIAMKRTYCAPLRRIGVRKLNAILMGMGRSPAQVLVPANLMQISSSHIDRCPAQIRSEFRRPIPMAELALDRFAESLVELTPVFRNQ
jgi:hypothetical protein